MNSVLKLGGAAIVFAGLVFVGNQSLNAQRAEAVEQFHIAETELPLMDTCKDAFSDAHVKFRSGVKTIIGCGCITRHVADRIDPSRHAIAGEIMQISIPAVSGKGNTQQAEEDLALLYRNSHLSRGASQKLMDAIGSAVQHCSSHQAYLSEADLAAARAKRDESRAETDARFEQYVAEGKMTRADVDRIKSYRNE